MAFDLYKNDPGYDFDWKNLGDISIGRDNLGDTLPVAVYRLFEYTLKDVLNRRYGERETIEIFREAGLRSGKAFAKNMLDLSLPLMDFIAHFQKTLEEFQIGVMRVESFDEETGKVVITVKEDLDCSGLPVTGKTVCNYDEGFLAGVLKEYTRKPYIVIETDCWSTGARACRFEADIFEEESVEVPEDVIISEPVLDKGFKSRL